MFNALQQRQQLGPHRLQGLAELQSQSPGDVHVHAAIEAGRFDRHIGEGLFFADKVAVGGGAEAELPLAHHVQTVLGRGIPQVIRQQRVDHHTVKREPMAQKDESVVFGVL